VLPRVLAGAATAWTVACLVAYLWVIEAQDGAVAWWYVVLMVFTALSLAFAALGIWARAALTVGLITSAFALPIALLSLGALLAPDCRCGRSRARRYSPTRKRTSAADQTQPSQQRGVSR
jgi:hypothetical protein